jgi:ubiquinone/menaquinone biosynthesis C-methylase UbiE
VGGGYGNTSRIKNEIEHGKFLAQNNAGEIWGWESKAGKVRWKRRVKMLTDFITPEMKVLEIGCGTGYFSQELIKTKAQIISIDISTDLLNVAKQNINSSNITFLVDNAYSMSFKNSLFDCVVGSSILHHLDIDKAFSEIYRVLKPNGKLFFTEPNMLNPQIVLQKNIPYLKRKLGDSPDETAFTKWGMTKDLRSHGFSDISVKPFDWLHPKTPEASINTVSKIGNMLEKIPIIKEFAGSLLKKKKKG